MNDPFVRRPDQVRVTIEQLGPFGGVIRRFEAKVPFPSSSEAEGYFDRLRRPVEDVVAAVKAAQLFGEASRLG